MKEDVYTICGLLGSVERALLIVGGEVTDVDRAHWNASPGRIAANIAMINVR